MTAKLNFDVMSYIIHTEINSTAAAGKGFFKIQERERERKVSGAALICKNFMLDAK